MRERRGSSLFLLSCRGITPAYAGKTHAIFSSNDLIRDHPRVCGKDIIFIGYDDSVTGSPPRMRERLFNVICWVVGCGITPADRKSTRLNSSHVAISYAVFCLKKKI